MPAAGLLLLGALAAAPAFGDTVAIEVASADREVAAVQVRLRWLGEERTVALEPAGEGRWQASLEGEAVRLLPVELWVEARGGEPQRAYAGLERMQGGSTVLAFAVEHARPAQARRLSHAAPPNRVATFEALRIGVGLVWLLACVLGLGLSLRRAPGPPGRPWRWPQLALPLLWLLLAVAWTWPALLAGDGLAVGRHFDLPGTLWAIDAAPRLLPDLRDGSTAWPVGGDYRRFDSFVLLPLAWIYKAADPARVHGLLQVLGLAATGLAAQAFARAIGARPPWDLLAGVLFALSGLAANALLEGHVYLLVDPWLPLFAWAWWRATGPSGTRLHGLLAGGAFALTLLTSGYLGVSAAVLAVSFLAWGLWRHGRAVLGPALVAAGVVALVAVPYLLPFLDAARPAGPIEDPLAIQLASAHLASLGPPTPEVDRAEHSMALACSGIMVGLLVAAPSLLGRGQRWQPLALGGLLALLLAMGPELAPGPHETWGPLPTGLLYQLPGASLLRFPARLAWGALLCSAGLAALAGTALEERVGARARLLVLLAIVEALVLVGMPRRQRTLSTAAPSAYALAEGPVLDLYPEALARGGDLESWFTGLSCLHQVRHRRPIADDCVATPVDAAPRHQLGRWLVARLLSGQGAQAGAHLGEMGFGAVAMHVDLFTPGDQRRLWAGMAAWGQGPAESVDGGERIVVFPVPRPDAGGDPRVAYAARESSGATAIGDPEAAVLPQARSLRIELVIPAARPTVRYALRWTPPGERARLVEIQNRGAAPDDLPGDQVWVAEIVGGLPGAFQAELVVTEAGVETVAWAGPVRLATVDDRIVLREEQALPPRFRPSAAAPSGQDGPTNRASGTVAAVGWCLVLAAGLGLGVQRRWQALRLPRLPSALRRRPATP